MNVSVKPDTSKLLLSFLLIVKTSFTNVPPVAYMSVPLPPPDVKPVTFIS